MDEPIDSILLTVAKTSSWQKAKAHLITLAACMPVGSVQHRELCDVIDQFVTHIEENNLHG